jgi:hypothetical protein
MKLQGYGSFDEKRNYEESGLEKSFYGIKYRNMVYHFILRDIPAFKDEQYITSVHDYIIKLDFQLSEIITTQGTKIKVLKDWESLVKDMIKTEQFGRYVKSSAKHYAKIAGEKGLTGKDQKEQIETVINDIKTSYSWNKLHSIYPDPLRNFITKKTGDCAEINLYLTGALRSIGIEAHPVILSTRGNGKIVRTYPFLEPFNYVIVYAKINDKWGLYDATDMYYPYNKIPEKCFNDYGLVINKDEIKWLSIIESGSSSEHYHFKSYFSPELDTLYSKVSFKSTGYDAVYFRKKFKNKIDDIEEYLSDNDLQTEGAVTTKNYDDVKKSYYIEFINGKTPNTIGNKIFIHPFQNIPLEDNPLKQKKRTYPIDMVYPNTKIFFTELQIPDNYSIEKLPESFSFDSKLVTIQYSAQKSEDKIMIQGTYKFKKSVYPPEDYAKIKHYLNLIIEKLNQKIVLIGN